MNKLALAAALALCAPAMAQSSRTHMPEGSKEIRAALVAVNAPRSVGSAQRETLVVPSFSVQWSNGFFVHMNEFGMRLSDDPGFDYGVLAVPAFSRASADAGRRFTPEVGGFFNYRLAHGMSLTSGLMYGGSSDHRGLRLRLGAQFWMPVAEHHTLGLVNELVLANRPALQADYAIAQVYEVSGGLHSSAIGGHWRWDLNHKYTLASSLQWRSLHGSAAASPRVEKANAVVAAVVLHYGF
jgi:outer membrane protein